jgi:hypothetical protein
MAEAHFIVLQPMNGWILRVPQGADFHPVLRTRQPDAGSVDKLAVVAMVAPA